MKLRCYFIGSNRDTSLQVLSKGLGLWEDAHAQILLSGQMLCLQHQTNGTNRARAISYRQKDQREQTLV